MVSSVVGEALIHAQGPMFEPDSTSSRVHSLLPDTWHLLPIALGLLTIPVPFSQGLASCYRGGDSGNFSAGQGALPDTWQGPFCEGQNATTSRDEHLWAWPRTRGWVWGAWHMRWDGSQNHHDPQGCPESGQAARVPCQSSASHCVLSWAQAWVSMDRLVLLLQPLASSCHCRGMFIHICVQAWSDFWPRSRH